MQKLKLRLSGIYFYDPKGHCYRKLGLKGFKIVKIRISKATYLKV